MRKIIAAAILLMTIPSSNATTIIRPKDPLASNFMVPLLNTGKMISLQDYSTLTVKEYKLIAGKKMSFIQRIKLKTSQVVLKKMIRGDGTLNMAKMKRYGFFGRWHWHWGGFALGFLLILGPIIALFFTDEYKWDRFWTSFVTMSVLLTLLVSLVATSIGP